MNPKETMEIQRQVEKLMSEGLVRESLSPCAIPTSLVPKKDGSQWMCVGSGAINKITVRCRYLVPKFEDILDELYGSRVFSKMDLRSWWNITMPRPCPWSTKSRMSKNKVPSSKDGLHFVRSSNSYNRVEQPENARFCSCHYLSYIVA